MRILITGGCGFQGSHLADYWLQAGHKLTLLNTWSDENERNVEALAAGVRIVWGSVTDREVVQKTVRSHDVVVHLAARVNVDESVKDPSSVMAVNMLGTQNVLDSALAHGARVIYASSCEVYGSAAPLPVSEESALKPHSPYAVSKAAGDRLSFAYYKTFGLNVTIMRPSNVYGPRQKDGGAGAVIPIFVRRALEQQPLILFGTGEQRREYLHVSDLVRAYDLVLLRHDLAGETLNCGTGEATAIRDIAAFVAARTSTSVVCGPARPGEVPAFLIDSSRIRALGFTPTVSFWSGLSAYIDERIAGCPANGSTSPHRRPGPLARGAAVAGGGSTRQEVTARSGHGP